ncbi:hypothetical protein DL89DRAFT_271417, partial [Linderina pennispora]
MKIAAIAALATVAAAADPFAIISEHWDQLTSLIEGDLPLLQAGNAQLYAVATSIIGGTKITQAFNTDLIQQVATGIPPAILNNLFERAGITGVTADGKPLPTGDSKPTAAEPSPEPTAAHSSSAEDKPSAAPPPPRPRRLRTSRQLPPPRLPSRPLLTPQSRAPRLMRSLLFRVPSRRVPPSPRRVLTSRRLLTRRPRATALPRFWLARSVPPLLPPLPSS